MEWHERNGNELDAAALYPLLRLRVSVFVVEQDCAYQELDGLDLAPSTRHLWAEADADDPDGAAITAYARLLAPTGSPHRARIGRVVVDPSTRRQRLGRALLGHGVTRCTALWPEADIALAAQAHLTGLYASLGFVPVSEAYLEDGIPHVDMLRARA